MVFSCIILPFQNTEKENRKHAGPLWFKVIYYILQSESVRYHFSLAEQTICEDDTGTINCPNGEILNIQYAYYGRWLTTICPNHIHPYATTNTGCSLNVTAIVTNECSQSSMTSCNLTPTNGLFTDPCEGTSKYLKVGFSCQQGALEFYI